MVIIWFNKLNESKFIIKGMVPVWLCTRA